MEILRRQSELPFNAIEFDKIETKDFLPALKSSILDANKKLDEYKKGSETSFKSVIHALGEIDDEIDYIVNVFYTLFHAHSTQDLQTISEEFSALLTEYGSEQSLDAGIFKRVKACYDAMSAQELTVEEKTILIDSYNSFVRNGALLSDSDKKKLKEIDQNLSKLSVDFQKNSLKATNSYKLFVTDESRLKGLSESALEQAKELAIKEDRQDAWAFSLQYPSLGPFLKNCEDRALRQEIAEHNGRKATTGEFSNQGNVKEQVRLRHERANLLGYTGHAAFVLEKKMATNVETVMSFLDDLFVKSKSFADSDVQKLKELAKEDGIENFESWDLSFYSEKLKKKELNFDDEVLRPYFKLENVMDGMFEIVNRLYDISFNKKESYPVYHKEVEVYEVIDNKLNKPIGLFYVDLFPRDTKGSGAWMMGIRKHGHQFGELKVPHVSITCNFTKPTTTKPSLLTLNELTTLFHEFGHALHGLLSTCEYKQLSGTAVYGDFVELPSQILENWVTEKECLDLFAKHYETDEKISDELIQKIKDSTTFMEGHMTMRQISFALLDMAWHGQSIENISDLDIFEFENKAMEKAMLLPRVEGSNMSCAFGHLFAGGYSAGYYGYKWAEVLDADAFEAFKEKGIFNKEVAASFRENILSKGGTEHPMELYKRFRGKGPSVDALLKRAGFAI
jgi:peptidyl-dipeptidase Dcp